MVLLQVLILNNVHIAGYATPFLYIYLILKFESDTPRNALMLWAFFLGLAVDVFSDTPGMNAAATVLLAFLRPLSCGCSCLVTRWIHWFRPSVQWGFFLS